MIRSFDYSGLDLAGSAILVTGGTGSFGKATAGGAPPVQDRKGTSSR